MTQKGRKRKRLNTPAKPLSHQDIREVGLKDDEKITLALAERDPEHAMKMAKNLIRAFRVRLKKMEVNLQVVRPWATDTIASTVC